MAVHRALEVIDLQGDLGHALVRLRERLPALVPPLVVANSQAAVLARARSLLDALSRSRRVLPRLREVASSVVARELPVLVSPEAGDDSTLDGLAGAVDMLYRDADGAWVVVDYKTDDVGDERDVGLRAEAYAPQARAYGRAVAAALGLPELPRLELWFLAADRIETVPAEGASRA
jgi:ATP-dependent exoDNAse (exonuclease V) beta subunit